MAVITKLTMQKDKTRANVYLDGDFVCGLSTLTIVKNGIKLGTEISKEELLLLVDDSEAERAYEKALSLLSRQRYTKRALINKLKLKGFDAMVVEGVVIRLEEYGYLGDKEYAQSYISANRTKSKRLLELNLINKGIKKEIIEEVLRDETDGEGERQKCRDARDKYLKNKTIDECVLKKLKAHLTYKGFGYEDINSVVKELGKGDLYCDD